MLVSAVPIAVLLLHSILQLAFADNDYEFDSYTDSWLNSTTEIHHVTNTLNTTPLTTRPSSSFTTFVMSFISPSSSSLTTSMSPSPSLTTSVPSSSSSLTASVMSSVSLSLTSSSSHSHFSNKNHTSPTTTPTGSQLSIESRLLLYITIPPLCLLVLIVIIVAIVLCIRRYRRMRKLRLHLMPLHNLEGSDDEEEEYEDDDDDDREAAFTISSTEGRQPILQFAET